MRNLDGSAAIRTTYRRLVPAVLFSLLCAATALPAAAQATLTPVSGPSALPAQLAAGTFNFNPQGMGYDGGELLFVQQSSQTIYVTDLSGNITSSVSIPLLPTCGGTEAASYVVSVAADADAYYFSNYTCNGSAGAYDLFRLDKTTDVVTVVGSEFAAYGGYPIDVRDGLLYRTSPSTDYDYSDLTSIRVSSLATPDTIIRTITLDTVNGIADFAVDPATNSIWALEYTGSADILRFDLTTGALLDTFDVNVDGLTAGLTVGDGNLYYWDWVSGGPSTLTTYAIGGLDNVPVAAADVPTATSWGLALAACALLVAGVMRLR